MERATYPAATDTGKLDRPSGGPMLDRECLAALALCAFDLAVAGAAATRPALAVIVLT